jgi:hypothetical protein
MREAQVVTGAASPSYLRDGRSAWGTPVWVGIDCLELRVSLWRSGAMRWAPRRRSFLLLINLLAMACTSSPSGARSPAGNTNSSTASPVEASHASTPEAICPGSAEWCQIPLDQVPSSLVRSLRFPELAPGGECPAEKSQEYDNGQFAGFALGRPPLQPLIAINSPSDAPSVKKGILRFRPSPEEPGWLQIKTLWFSRPSYQGPALIRGRQLDGANPILFGESPSLTDPFLTAGPTANGEHGFREWPGATWLRAPGCYVWQVDGVDFSYSIVFEATVER